VARGTQHRKRRPAQNARTAAVAAPRKQKPPQWQEDLFFQRLRVHAKWAFVLLALVFALGFVFLGIGSGSTGITGALQQAFNFGHSAGGTSISSLKKKTEKHPGNAQDWRALATAYETKQQTANAIAALKKYTALRPKDTSALAELGSEYSDEAQTYATQYQVAAAQGQNQGSAGDAFAPPSTTPLGKAFNDPNALKDPIAAAVQAAASANEDTAFQSYQAAQIGATTAYRELVTLTPNDANAQLELGQAAQAANATQVSITAYEKFLKLAPHDPLAAQVKSQLASLRTQVAQQNPTVTSSKKSSGK
jgi:cytochrome c-type biogenesis protein CcmH/NrfG